MFSVKKWRIGAHLYARRLCWGLGSPLCCLLLAGFFTLSSVHAANIQFRDQQGNPVADVVVMAPSVPMVVPPLEITVVDQVNKQFLPKVQTIQAGTKVSFPNSDAIRHHVYSFSKAKPFEIKLYSGVPSEPVVFETPGIVVLGCNIHDSMVGYIVVADQHFIAKTDANGEVQLPEKAQTLVLWHPRLQGGIDKTEQIVAHQGKLPATYQLQLKQPVLKKQNSKFGNHLIRHGN